MFFRPCKYREEREKGKKLKGFNWRNWSLVMLRPVRGAQKHTNPLPAFLTVVLGQINTNNPTVNS